MSYDINLVDKDGNMLFADNNHKYSGGTYALGGTKELWLNVTYNYSQIFRQVLGDKGIRTIYGMKAQDAIPILEQAASRLKNDVTDNYWEVTEGNAKLALLNLIGLAKLAPEGIFKGD